MQKTSYPTEIFFCWRKGFKFNRNLLSNDQETVHIIQSRVFVFWEVASATRKLMIKTRIKANHILVKAFIWCICIILWIWIFIRIFIAAVLSSFFSFLPIVIFVRLRIGHLEFTISRLIRYVSSPSTHFAPVQLKPRKHWGWNGFA